MRETSKARPQALFLDDGGVLNDNSLREPEWIRLIGEFMPTRLGGTAEQWASANRVVFPEVWGYLSKRMAEFASHREFHRSYTTSWTKNMCARVGVAPPPDDDAVRLYNELAIYIAERAACEVAGAGDAVRSLHRGGYTLFTASGTPSWELRGILARMGISETFSGLYGPDLVDHVKFGPTFYQKMFAHAGIEPSGALVIESDQQCCGWASEVGATAIWVDHEGRGEAETLEAVVALLA